MFSVIIAGVAFMALRMYRYSKGIHYYPEEGSLSLDDLSQWNLSLIELPASAKDELTKQYGVNVTTDYYDTVLSGDYKFDPKWYVELDANEAIKVLMNNLLSIDGQYHGIDKKSWAHQIKENPRLKLDWTNLTEEFDFPVKYSNSTEHIVRTHPRGGRKNWRVNDNLPPPITAQSYPSGGAAAKQMETTFIDWSEQYPHHAIEFGAQTICFIADNKRACFSWNGPGRMLTDVLGHNTRRMIEDRESTKPSNSTV